jgi:hypothetical protein
MAGNCKSHHQVKLCSIGVASTQMLCPDLALDAASAIHLSYPFDPQLKGRPSAGGSHMSWSTVHLT